MEPSKKIAKWQPGLTRETRPCNFRRTNILKCQLPIQRLLCTQSPRVPQGRPDCASFFNYGDRNDGDYGFVGSHDFLEFGFGSVWFGERIAVSCHGYNYVSRGGHTTLLQLFEQHSCHSR